MSAPPTSRIVLEGLTDRRRLPTGVEGFDKYFGIMSGTANICYIQNQTFQDPMPLFNNWLTNDLQDDETILLVSTYADPIAIARWCKRREPESYKAYIKASQQKRFWWIDLFTYTGFGEHERESITVSYPEQFEEMGGDPVSLVVPRKPDDLQSVEGLPAAIQKIISPLHGKQTVRMFLAYVDDFIDGVGPQKARNYMRRLFNIIRKFGHTLVILMGWRTTLPEIHTSWERMADQVLRWGYGDLPGSKTPSKFLQTLRTTAPDEVASYLKIPYHIRKGQPEIGKPAQQEKPSSARRSSRTKRR